MDRKQESLDTVVQDLLHLFQEGAITPAMLKSSIAQLRGQYPNPEPHPPTAAEEGPPNTPPPMYDGPTPVQSVNSPLLEAPSQTQHNRYLNTGPPKSVAHNGLPVGERFSRLRDRGKGPKQTHDSLTPMRDMVMPNSNANYDHQYIDVLADEDAFQLNGDVEDQGRDYDSLLYRGNRYDGVAASGRSIQVNGRMGAPLGRDILLNGMARRPGGYQRDAGC